MAAHIPEARSKAAELRSGWRVLLASTLGIGGGIIAIPFYTNALFFPKLSAEFGWSKANLSLVVLAYNLAWALILPLMGRLTDRFGVRIPALLSGLFLAVGYFLMSIVGDSFTTYFVIVLVTMVLAIGTGAIGYARAVGLAFDRMRGLALGIILAGSGVTAVLAPQLLGPVIEGSGWRAGFRILAVTVLILTAAVFLLMPSRIAGGAASSSATGADVEADTTKRTVPLGRVFSDHTFQRLVVAFICMALAVGGLVIHLYAMMLNAGVSKDTALWVQSSMGFAVVLGRLLSGYLFDKFHAPKVAGAIMGLAVVGLCALLFGGPQLALVASFAVGFCIGAEVDVIALLVSRYFAMDVFGQVYGLAYSAYAFGLAGSPYLIGLLVDNTTGYAPTVTYSVVLLLVASVVFWTLPKYGRPRLAANETDGSPVGHVRIA